MPLFRSKFQPKKSPARRATSVSSLRRSLDPSQVEQEFGLQVNRIKLDLGHHQQLEFDEQHGRWIYQGKTSKTVKLHDKTEAEANLLKVQVQVLLDMLTETALEAHLETSGAAEESKSSTKKNNRTSRKLFN